MVNLTDEDRETLGGALGACITFMGGVVIDFGGNAFKNNIENYWVFFVLGGILFGTGVWAIMKTSRRGIEREKKLETRLEKKLGEKFDSILVDLKKSEGEKFEEIIQSIRDLKVKNLQLHFSELKFSFDIDKLKKQRKRKNYYWSIIHEIESELEKIKTELKRE